MRVCLIGHYHGHLDEGVKNIAFYLAQELSKQNDVLKIDIRDIRSWERCKKFRPQILHFILSPSDIRSFAVAKIMAAYVRTAIEVMSAPNPGNLSFRGLISFLSPDLVLVQSDDTEKMFRELGCKTEFLPNGVDPNRFVPVPESVRERLREKYGISRGKFVILHVGPIKRSRSLEILGRMQDDSNQVFIVGRTPTVVERDLYQWLKERGCIVRTDYLRKIEEVYALSDCYVFPTKDRFGSVEMPLSVLEAMSCNLPVISTRFGGLPRAFRADEGLTFVEEDKDFLYEMDKVKLGSIEAKTRKKVLPYSWDIIAKKLSAIYGQLIHKELRTKHIHKKN